MLVWNITHQTNSVNPYLLKPHQEFNLPCSKKNQHNLTEISTIGKTFLCEASKKA
jgi:hypothetical protein